MRTNHPLDWAGFPPGGKHHYHCTRIDWMSEASRSSGAERPSSAIRALPPYCAARQQGSEMLFVSTASQQGHSTDVMIPALHYHPAMSATTLR